RRDGQAIGTLGARSGRLLPCSLGSSLHWASEGRCRLARGARGGFRLLAVLLCAGQLPAGRQPGGHRPTRCGPQSEPGRAEEAGGLQGRGRLRAERHCHWLGHRLHGRLRRGACRGEAEVRGAEGHHCHPHLDPHTGAG
ncbi:unnamed protein product, partial [Effrenium voratum]